MPATETDGLMTNAFLKRNDPREILIAKENKKLKELKDEAIIGPSSDRREFKIKNNRTDLNCKVTSGNVDTRNKNLKERLWDGKRKKYQEVNILKHFIL